MYIGKRTPIENEEEQKNKVKICEDTMNICKNVEAQRVRNTVFIKMLSLNIYQNHDTGRRKRGFH